MRRTAADRLPARCSAPSMPRRFQCGTCCNGGTATMPSALAAEALSATAVSKHFGGLVAVEDMSFQLAEKQVLGLIGPNGSGKTTVSYTHLRAHETRHDLVCRLLLEKKKK